jgi:hypothetical protein
VTRAALDAVELAVGAAFNDELNGQPNGNIITKGCKAAGYVDPDAAADAFVIGAALAAISVLKEPTPEMLEAGEALIPWSPGTESRRGMPGPADIWRAMIDAAIQKAEPAST